MRKEKELTYSRFFGVMLSPKDRERLRDIADQNEVPMATIARVALRTGLDRFAKEGVLLKAQPRTAKQRDQRDDSAA